ncbi:MAG: hypothetical protein WEC84_04200 [Candidatus Andersenbacteria bacterium]
MKKPWFKRKLFGWGWYPASWEGWLVTLTYAALVISFARTIDENSPRQEIAFTFLLPVTFLTLLFIRIAYRTGETPQWQWGRRKEDY